MMFEDRSRRQIVSAAEDANTNGFAFQIGDLLILCLGD